MQELIKLRGDAQGYIPVCLPIKTDQNHKGQLIHNPLKGVAKCSREMSWVLRLAIANERNVDTL